MTQPTCDISYHLVYSVIDEGYTTWPVALIGLVIVVFGVLDLRFSKKPRVPELLVLVAALGCIATLIGTYVEYALLRGDLRDGNAVLVEGRVTNFSPEPPMGHKPETFDVSGTHFAYQGVGGVSAAFNQSQAKGGPIHEGAFVRIWHVDGKIARLELGERDCP